MTRTYHHEVHQTPSGLDLKHRVVVRWDGRFHDASEWVTYRAVASLSHEGRTLCGVTDYHEGSALPVGQVFEVRIPEDPPRLFERRNATQQDAFNRVLDAKIGSLANASDEYLIRLAHELQLWSASAADELAARMARSQARTAFDRECVICQNEGSHDLGERGHVYEGQE